MVEGVMPLHEEELKPAYRRVSFPIQTNIRGVYPSENQKVYILGRFFEIVTRGLYGGKLNDKKFGISYSNGRVFEDHTIKPDVVDTRRGIRWESKGSYCHRTCDILRSQFEGYKSLQYDSHDKIFCFALYRHSLDEVKKRRRTEEEIISGLAERTAFSIVLPLSVIIALRDISSHVLERMVNIQKTDASGRYLGCLKINISTMSRFLTDPDQNLEYLRLDPDKFLIERYISPGKFFVGGNGLNQFPIVKITNKSHPEWVEKFMQDYEREAETLGDEGIEHLPIFEQGDTPF